MKKNDRGPINQSWRETAELLGLSPDELEDEVEVDTPAEVEPEAKDESDEPTAFSEATIDGGFCETMPELESSDNEEIVVSKNWSEEPTIDGADELLSFSMRRPDEDTVDVEEEDAPGESDFWGDEDAVTSESESFDAYDADVEVHIEEFNPDGDGEVALTPPEPEEKPVKKGRKRGRRGRKSKKPAETSNGDDAPPVEAAKKDEKDDADRRKKSGKKGKKEAQPEDDDEDDGIADWSVPSWDELIASLYSPD